MKSYYFILLHLSLYLVSAGDYYVLSRNITIEPSKYWISPVINTPGWITYIVSSHSPKVLISSIVMSEDNVDIYIAGGEYTCYPEYSNFLAHHSVLNITYVHYEEKSQIIIQNDSREYEALVSIVIMFYSPPVDHKKQPISALVLFLGTLVILTVMISLCVASLIIYKRCPDNKDIQLSDVV